MPKRILAVDFNVDRQQTLFRELCSRFEVVTMARAGFDKLLGVSFRDAMAVLPSDLEFSETRLVKAKEAFQREAATFIEKMVPGPRGEKLLTAHAVNLEAAAIDITQKQMLVEAVMDHMDFDWVVVDTGTQGQARLAALEAAKRGLPCLVLYHGFGGPLPSGVFTSSSAPLDVVPCTHINVDHPLESKAHEKRWAGSNLPMPEILTMGTVIDETADVRLSRQEAKKSLGLNTDKTTLVYLVSYSGTFDLQHVFEDQLQQPAQLHDLLKGLGGFEQKDQFELVIKLHLPFGKVADLFEESKQQIMHWAKRFGVKHLHVTADRYPEVMRAADLVVSPVLGSSLWEAFALETPGLFWPMPWVRENLVSRDHLVKGAPLIQEGVLDLAFTDEEVWSWVSRLMDAGQQEAKTQKIQTVKKAFGVEWASAAEKAKALCDFLEKN